MKRILLAFFCLSICLLTSKSFAQDIITLHTGEELKVEIKEVSKTEVKYKKISFYDGPLFTLPISDIFMIKYSNGEKEVFTKPQVSNATSVGKKEPALSFLFSFLLPGGGQYYNGEYRKGALMTGLWLGSFVGMAASIPYDDDDYYDNHNKYNGASDTGPIFTLFALVYMGNYIWSVIDAPVSANKINKQNMLSWNIGKDTRISIKPDFNLQSYNTGGFRSIEPTYGAKISLNFK